MKEAMYYSSKKGVVTCELCPRNCKIKEGMTGICRVRKNIDGKLYSLVYGKAAGGLGIDPIEKKPLFHFLPGSRALSFGTVGCNLSCKHCQNYNSSQGSPGAVLEKEYSPKDVVGLAKEHDCRVIAYTYNEPTIFYEYMLDTAKLAKKAGIKNVIVSNGFINEKPLKELCKYIDGVNIDLKGFDDIFYKKITSAWVGPVLKSLKILKEKKVWIEITNLIIPSFNDDLEEIKKMCEWIIENLGSDVPLHFSAFHPDFEMQNIPMTPIPTLLNAYDIAKNAGLKYVYVGNVILKEHENTSCPKCGKIVIERFRYQIVQDNVVEGKCKFCEERITGIF